VTFGLVLGACTVSPQPQPVPGRDVRLDPDALCVDAVGSAVEILGTAGAATPGGSTVIALDLDGAAPEASAVSAPDGSFRIATGGALGHRFELRARFEVYEALPIEITGPSCP
jgi:hypothetical protein